MEKDICEVICIEKNCKKHAIIELTEHNDNVAIKFSLEKLVLEEKADNYFDALINLRKELEERNIKLLCKGCCRNVYPSGMLLSMGTGRNAYTLIFGKHAKMDSLVDIFDSCSMDEYATLDEQLEYFENWISSIRG
ncbi:MAG: hypothetical protein NC489_21860 [Ruminococcus flavefaciens]|nr:hypothetical protein [Ruminococcus flavefaciens]